jgi:molecular chaperone GrpE
VTPRAVPDGDTGSGTTAPEAGDEQPVADVADPESERRQLIDLLIYAWDRARSPGVWQRLTEGLAAVGVQVLRPDGELFDPNVHEAGGIEQTDDEARVDTVAETEVAGFADRGTVIREPVVVVYRHRAARQGDRADTTEDHRT